MKIRLIGSVLFLVLIFAGYTGVFSQIVNNNQKDSIDESSAVYSAVLKDINLNLKDGGDAPCLLSTKPLIPIG